ncbi:MAG: hypothetical protein ACTS82_00560 [Arsenophonus sp. ET-DL12-MAG3]
MSETPRNTRIPVAKVRFSRFNISFCLANVCQLTLSPISYSDWPPVTITTSLINWLNKTSICLLFKLIP